MLPGRACDRGGWGTVSGASGLRVDGIKATESRGEERWDGGRLLDGAAGCGSLNAPRTGHPERQGRDPQVIDPDHPGRNGLPG